MGLPRRYSSRKRSLRPVRPRACSSRASTPPVLPRPSGVPDAPQLCAEMHLQAVVMHVSFDPGARLEFEELGNVHGPRDLAVHHQVRYADFPFDTSLLTQHQGRRFVGNRSHVSNDFTVDTKASGEIDVALDLRADTNQAVDAILRLARLLAKHSASCLLRKVDVLAGTGLARPVLQDTRLYGPHPGSRRNPKCPLNSTKILEVELESSVARLG